MNRAERRAALRDQRRRNRSEHVEPWPSGHSDCDCTARWVTPLGSAACPACGKQSALVDPAGFLLPTTTPPGGRMRVEVGCSCGVEYGLLCRVAS